MRVLLIVIDAATPRVVGPAIKTGRLPVLKRLADAGVYHDRCISIFPSITPAATASIITGEYPAASGIIGASWLEKDSHNVHYYGDDFWVIARKGFESFLDDFLIRLNGDRLRAATMFEMVERAQQRAACLNYLVFKGLHEHEARVPHALRLLPGVQRTEQVKGPSILALGDFLTTRPMRNTPLEQVTGLFDRFGMDDASTSELLLELLEERPWPDFTVAYYADNDYCSHEVGPHAALETIERVDRGLGRAFEAAGGIDKVLSEMFVVVTADHGHCEILGNRDEAAICVDQVLSDFRQAKLGRPWNNGDEIMICPNMRATQIYFRHPSARAVRRAVDRALSDARIEHAICREVDLGEAPDHFWIQSAKGGLEFWRGATGHAHARDAYGTEWSWNGDLDVIDGHVESGEIVWEDYPNAFERLAGVLEHCDSGTVWLTARPGCEFEVPGGEAHVDGASHGALHELESYCPFIIAGPERVELPRHFRTVDIAPLCLRLLGLPSRHRVGDPRRA